MPAWTSVRRVESRRSPTTLSVILPAVRAVTATVIVSPLAYSALSSAILEQVRGVGRGVRIESRIERHGGGRNAAIIARYIEPVAAIGDGSETRRAGRRHVEAAVGDAAHALTGS